ncbi:MAG TPA: glycine betaine ABC transporter substrate-binding protein [Candidatus Limnocylindrales bacterium]|nr:glycine betaine ABC transporter substrate-binding protein [Candidatus Limnocylindrales bacterium]
MRMFRSAVVGAALVALIVGACGPGGDSQTPAAPADGTPAATAPGAGTPAGSPIPTILPGARTLDQALTFGGPPECPERPFCLVGLRDVYDLEFGAFRPLDVGGPITVEALASGEIDVALLFSSDPTIAMRDFVSLEDDMQLMRADNLVPVLNAELAREQPVVDLLNEVSSRLSQEELIELNRQAVEDRDDPRDIASSWLEEQGIEVDSGAGAGYGETITVGRTNFYEQDILAELYAQVLEQAGYTVDRQEASGAREVVFGALEAGEIDILPEYAATALEFVNEGAGEASGDAEETTGLLRDRLEGRGLTALDPAPAANQNAIVVTRQLAEQYNLVRISDLAQALPDETP